MLARLYFLRHLGKSGLATIPPTDTNNWSPMLFSQLIQSSETPLVFPSPGTDLLPNPGLTPHPNMRRVPNPWTYDSGERLLASHHQRGWSFELNCADDIKARRAAMIMVGQLPPGRPLEICFKATAVNNVNSVEVSIQGFDEMGHQVMEGVESQCLKADKAESIRVATYPNNKVRTLKIIFRGTITSSIRFSKVRLIAGIPPTFPRTSKLSGAGLIYVTAKTRLAPAPDSSRNTISFPVPIQLGNQIPIAFELTTLPQNALSGFRWIVSPDQTNLMCHAAIDAPPEGVELGWESLVFVDQNKSSHSAKTNLPGPNTCSSEYWGTRSGDDPSGLVHAADALYKEAASLDHFAERVTKLAHGRKVWQRIATALLQAKGIPNRIGVALPTDLRTYHKPEAFVEWLHPELGWKRLRPPHRKEPPKDNQQVILQLTSDNEIRRVNGNTLSARPQQWKPFEYAKYFVSDGTQSEPTPHNHHVSNQAHPVMHLQESRGLLESLRTACRRTWRRQVADARFGLASSRRNSEILTAVHAQDSRRLLAALNA